MRDFAIFGRRAPDAAEPPRRQRRRSGLPRQLRFLRTLKLVLPAVAAALVALVAVWPQLSPRGNAIPIGTASMDPSELDDLSMINARFHGLDGRSQPYSVTAAVAREMDAEGNAVLLDGPKADITMTDGSWLALTSTEGVFRRGEQTIELAGDVNLFHDAGYEFHTTSAHIDLTHGSAFGFEPVVGHGPFGNIRSEGFQVLDEGESVFFTGKATLVLYPGSGGGE